MLKRAWPVSLYPPAGGPLPACKTLLRCPAWPVSLRLRPVAFKLAVFLKAFLTVICGKILRFLGSLSKAWLRNSPECVSITRFPRLINILRLHLPCLETDRHFQLKSMPAARACAPRRARLARPAHATTSFRLACACGHRRRHFANACTGAHLYFPATYCCLHCYAESQPNSLTDLATSYRMLPRSRS